MSNAYRRVFWSLLALSACEFPLSDEHRAVSGAMEIASVRSNAAKGVVGPYVSVIDSLALSIVPSAGGVILLGRHLAPNDTILTLPLTIAKGAASVSVKVLSNNGAVLYTGAFSPTIDRDGFTIRIPVVPILPVLVVAPDIATTSVLDTNRWLTRFSVHNSGSKPLIWSVMAVSDTAFKKCIDQNLAASTCTATPAIDTVAPNRSKTLTFAFPVRNARPYFSTAHVFSFLIRSAQGDVTAQWRYP